MDAEKYIAEVYRRRHNHTDSDTSLAIPYKDFIKNKTVEAATFQYQSILPKNKNAKIDSKEFAIHNGRAGPEFLGQGEKKNLAQGIIC